jgi:spermidine synthase
VSSRNSFRVVLCGSFFLAGFAALALEVLWARDVQRFTGTALPTVALVSAMFMTGLLVGSCIASKFANRFQQPLRVYALSQALLAGIGLTFILFRPQLYALLEIISTANPHTRTLAECLRLIVIGAFLLVPTSLMGTGFPSILLTLAKMDSNEPPAKNEAQFDACLAYFANVFGSLIGTLTCGFYLLSNFGIALSIQLVSLLSLIAGIGAYIAGELAKEDMLDTTPVPLDQSESTFMSDLDAGIVVICSGFVIMLLEMLWFRLGILVLGSSSYALSVILVCVLLGLSAGSFLVASLPTENGAFKLPGIARLNAVPIVKAAAGFAGLWIVFSAYLSSILPELFLRTMFWLQSFASALPTLGFFSSRLLIGALVILLPCIALGMFFPLALKGTPDHSTRTPWLYVLNIFGSIQGCILGGVLLLPTLARITPTPLMLAFLSAGFFLIAFAVAFKHNCYVRLTRILAVIAALSVVALIAIPLRWPSVVMSSGPAYLVGLAEQSEQDQAHALKAIAPDQEKNLLFYQEGVNAITTVMQDPANNLRLLRTDGKIEAALPADPTKPFPDSDAPTHILLGELPMLLCPRPPKDVLLIGLGSGLTADAILDHGSVVNLTVAELEDSVRAALPFFSQNRHNDGDARMKIVNCDGRNYLSLLKGDYDVIVSQPGEPFLTGMADLYTLEFWKLAQHRLRQSGVFCQWVQLYAVDRENLAKMCRTFHAVFPNSLIFRSEHAGEILMVGFNVSQSSEPTFSGRKLFNYIQSNTPSAQTIKGYFPFSSGLWIDYNQFCHRFAEPKVRQRLTYIGLEEPLELITTLRMGPADLSELIEHSEPSSRSRLNLDDSTKVEWALPLELNQHGPLLQKTILDLFSGVPSDVDQFFFNIGTTKFDTAGFIAECAFRYAARSSQLRSKAERNDDYERCMKLAIQALRFAYCPATLAGKALVIEYFGKRMPPSLRGLYGANAGASTEREDCRAVGLFYAVSKQTQNALLCFQKAVVIAPQSAQSWLDLSSYLWSMGQVKPAADGFARMMEADHYSARAREGAGIALVALGQSDSGISLLKQALSMNPNLFRARLVLGRSLLQKGNEKEGLSQLYWASRVNPDNPEPNLAVTAYWATINKWQPAEENLTILIKQLPGDIRVNYLKQIIAARHVTDRLDPKVKALLDPITLSGNDPFGTNSNQLRSN